MTMTQAKRYKPAKVESSKGRQLSGLFNIISSNLLLASEVLGQEYVTSTVRELEQCSKEARDLAQKLLNSSNGLYEDLSDKVSSLKHKMLTAISNLTEEINKIDTSKNGDAKKVEDILLVKRLLRESQRGLVTIQD